jgi:L-fuconolactonase
VSSPGKGEDFASPEFAALVEALPDVPIVIEHLGGGNSETFALSRFPNVFLKVPGLGELAPRSADRNAAFPFERSRLGVLDEALAAFGPGRLMWGSDFPVVCSREGYANALRLCIEAFAGCSATDRELIFGGVADRVFK